MDHTCRLNFSNNLRQCYSTIYSSLCFGSLGRFARGVYNSKLEFSLEYFCTKLHIIGDTFFAFLVVGWHVFASYMVSKFVSTLNRGTWMVIFAIFWKLGLVMETSLPWVYKNSSKLIWQNGQMNGNIFIICINVGGFTSFFLLFLVWRNEINHLVMKGHGYIHSWDVIAYAWALLFPSIKTTFIHHVIAYALMLLFFSIIKSIIMQVILFSIFYIKTFGTKNLSGFMCQNDFLFSSHSIAKFNFHVKIF